MKRGYRCFATAAALHLTLVALSAAHVPVSGRAVAVYGAYTGATNGYGFYAPAVASEWRISYLLCDREGHCVPATERPPNRETTLLLATVSSLFAVDEYRDVLAASLAASQLGRHPKTASVIVRAEIYALPTMKEYRSGRRPEWTLLYERGFRRADR